MSKLLLHIILITGLGYAQQNYPADTVLASPQASIFEKLLLCPFPLGNVYLIIRNY